MCALRRCAASAAALIAIGLGLLGCATIEGGPDRLYSVSDEVALARQLLDGEKGLVQEYYNATDPIRDEAKRVYYRNEIIARRMYVIDVEYSKYEAALTSDRQKFGFATSTLGQALTIASPLTTPERSALLVGGAASLVGATRGFYDSEIVIAKTIQIAQGQMRALRDGKATVIQAKTVLSSTAYPLSAALHDLEDYYRAGTLAAGLIKAVGEAGTSAQLAAITKDSVYTGTYGPDDTSNIIQKYITAGGKPNIPRIRALNGLLLEMGYKLDVRTIVDSTEALPIRKQLIDYAARRGIDLTK